MIDTREQRDAVRHARNERIVNDIVEFIGKVQPDLTKNIQLSEHETIMNPRAFLSGHIGHIKKYKGKAITEPYVRRLIKFAILLGFKHDARNNTTAD